MDKRKIIIDCDPGHDDAIAILLAYGNPKIDLVAITTVAGNQTLPKTTLNARRVCTVANITDVPIAPGMAEPLFRKQVVAEDIHGDSGLDGPVFPDPTVPVSGEHGVDLIIRKLMESDGDITLVPVGPLTNIAMAMIREPRILPKIKEIVLMGGNLDEGNCTPAAEFNIYADAEAARIVFQSGVPLVMMGLNLTHQATATAEVRARFKAINNPVAKLVGDLLEFFGKTYKEVFNFDAPPVHDACAVAYCIDPEVFVTKDLYVDVETQGELTYGRTVVDLLGVTHKAPNCKVAMTLNHKGFWDLVVDAVSHY